MKMLTFRTGVNRTGLDVDALTFHMSHKLCLIQSIVIGTVIK